MTYPRRYTASVDSFEEDTQCVQTESIWRKMGLSPSEFLTQATCKLPTLLESKQKDKNGKRKITAALITRDESIRERGNTLSVKKPKEREKQLLNCVRCDS